MQKRDVGVGSAPGADLGGIPRLSPVSAFGTPRMILWASQGCPLDQHLAETFPQPRHWESPPLRKQGIPSPVHIGDFQHPGRSPWGANDACLQHGDVLLILQDITHKPSKEFLEITISQSKVLVT